MAKAGRPSKFETHIKPFIENGELEKMASDPNMNKRKIAKRLGVSYSVFMEHQKKFPEIQEIFKKAESNKIESLEEATIKEATGYWIEEEEKIIKKDEDGIPHITIRKNKRWQRPNATLQIFLLCNWTQSKSYKGQKYERDPVSTQLRKEDLKFRKEQADKGDW